MRTRKAFVRVITHDELVTPVRDSVGLFVPDQSLSIKEIITRFAVTGDVSALQRLNDGLDGDDRWDDDGMTDLASMDIAEVQALADRANQIIDDYRRARNDLAKPIKPAAAPAPSDDADA